MTDQRPTPQPPPQLPPGQVGVDPGRVIEQLEAKIGPLHTELAKREVLIGDLSATNAALAGIVQRQADKLRELGVDPDNLDGDVDEDQEYEKRQPDEGDDSAEGGGEVVELPHAADAGAGG